MEVRLWWAGHVVRMGEERLPRALLYSELSDVTRPFGAPKKRFKDQLKKSLAKCGKPLPGTKLSRGQRSRLVWPSLRSAE